MNDLVLVALISAGAALLTALATQFLATRAASRQADRAERREALQWQRSEASRQEALAREAAREALAWQRAEAQRLQVQQDERLRELWGHVLTARWQVLDALERVPVQGRPGPAESPVLSAEVLPAHAAGQAYSVALLGLAAVRPGAKAFYLATSQFQHAQLAANGDAMLAAATERSEAYDALEHAVAALADVSAIT